MGHFSGDTAYSLSGTYIGEMHDDDTIGKWQGVARSSQVVRVDHVGIGAAQPASRAEMGVAGWDDPDF